MRILIKISFISVLLIASMSIVYGATALKRETNLKRDSLLKSKITKPLFVPGEVLVKFKDGSVHLSKASAKTKVLHFAKSFGLKNKEIIKGDNLSLLKITDKMSVEN